MVLQASLEITNATIEVAHSGEGMAMAVQKLQSQSHTISDHDSDISNNSVIPSTNLLPVVQSKPVGPVKDAQHQVSD